MSSNSGGKSSGRGRKSGNEKFGWVGEKANAAVRALVIVPEFRNFVQNPVLIDEDDVNKAGLPIPVRSIGSRVEEANGLARAINLDICESVVVGVRTVRPSTLFGKGKVEEIAGLARQHGVELAIVDHAISPVQQQNLEKAWDCKVLDRTALILEIFGERAQTREGRTQVELAHLNYQKGRLVRSWTHLERQRGGLGFVGGPGETQIEADRRMIRERIRRLEDQLKKIQRTRSLHRAKRRKVPHPIVALVGYTNAGKSTLFNTLTGSDVFAKDQLFATLDPTLRQLELANGTRVILSDTVGFVSNLPTHLIAAFRATLEEVIEADLIVHVRDISDPESEHQSRDVYKVMRQLGVDIYDSSLILEAWNKIDLLDNARLDAIAHLKTAQGKKEQPYLISAVKGEGLSELLAEIEQRISGGRGLVEITLGLGSLSKLGWVYENTNVLERKDQEDGSVKLKIRASANLVDEVCALDSKGQKSAVS